MRLRQDGSPSDFLEGVPLDLSEEDVGYMMSGGLEHHHWARGFLRRIDPEARRRFSGAGWAYGDPTYMGGSPEQLYDSQLDSVLAALFPRLTGEVLTVTEGDLAPGLILDPETGRPVDADDDLLHSVDWIVLAMFRGRTPNDVARLERGLRLAVPDRKILRRAVEEPADEHNAVLVFDAQWGPDETIYYELFEGLIKAYEALRKEEENPLLNEAGAADSRRVRRLEKGLEVRLEDEGAGRAAGAGHEQEEGDEARDAVVALELRRGALPVIRLRNESGVLVTKTVSFVALLSLLDRSSVVDALDDEAERRTALPPLPAGALLVDAVERPRASSIVLTGYLEPASRPIVLRRGGAAPSVTTVVPLPSLVYRAEWSRRGRTLRTLAIAACSPDLTHPPGPATPLFRFPLSNVYGRHSWSGAARARFAGPRWAP